MNSLYIALTLVAISPADLEEIQRIETAALASRLKIQSWEIELSSRIVDFTGSSISGLPETTRIFYSDGSGQLRMDELESMGGTSSRRVNCYSKSGFINYLDHDRVNGAKPNITLVPISEVESNANQEFLPYKILDPRILGMIPIGSYNLVTYSIDDFVGAANREGFSIEQVTRKGINCALIKYKFKGGNYASEWIATDPGMGYRVLRVEARPYLQEGSPSISVDNTYDVDEETGIHFPITSFFESKSGPRLDQREEVTIRRRRFNFALDPAVFKLAGIKPEAGRPISYLDSGTRKDLVWDGSKIVDTGSTDSFDLTSGPLSTQAQSSWWMPWLIVAAILFGSVGVLLLLKSLRRKRTGR